LHGRHFFDSFGPVKNQIPWNLKTFNNGIFARPLEIYEGPQEMVASPPDYCVAAYWSADSIWR
jgi:hypothetical protein